MRAIIRTWRYIAPRHVVAALAAGPLIALLVTLSTLHLNMFWAPWKVLYLTPWYIAFAGIFVLAVAFVEANAPRRRPSMRRYVVAAIVAAIVCMAVGAAFADSWPMAPRRVVYGSNDPSTRYVAKHQLPSVVFANGLDGVLHCCIGLFIYARLRNARIAARALHHAQVRGSRATAMMLNARLAVARGRVDPAALSHALEEIERAYWADSARAERMLDELIEFLRAAIPQVRGEDSRDIPRGVPVATEAAD